MPTIEELNARTLDGTPTGAQGFQPFDPMRGIDAMEAQKQALAFSRIQKQQRRVPVPSRMMAEQRAAHRVWIYNVGPWRHERHLGDLGTFIVPALPDGPEAPTYVRMEQEIPFGVLVIKDERQMEFREEAGFGGVEGAQYNAQQIIGLGPFLSPANCLIQMGVFIGSEEGPHARPTKAELQAAREALEQYYLALVADARIAAERGPKVAEAEITDKHHLAAKRLNLDPKVELWMSRKMASANTRQSCPNCGTVSDLGIAQCPSCRNILDEAKFLENEERQQRIRAKLKQQKG